MRCNFHRLAVLFAALLSFGGDAFARSSGPRVVSTCGRHVLEVAGGRAVLDGRPVWGASAPARVLSSPVWRSDGRAVAWLERDGVETRLVIIAQVESPADALPWHLPAVASGDQVFWAARNRVVVGPHLLAPRAVASWTETVR
jgi:hypothetical protein